MSSKRHHDFSPSQMLDMQADLSERFATNGQFKTFVESVLNRMSHVESHVRTNSMGDDIGSQLIKGFSMAARAADLYRVSKDMCLLNEYAASQLTDEDTFTTDTAPSTIGLMRLARPLKVVDVRGRTMLAHWFLWYRTSIQVDGTDMLGRPHQPIRGVAVSWWNDHVTEPDDVAREMLSSPHVDIATTMRSLGRWGLIAADIYREDQAMGPAMAEIDEATIARIVDEGAIPHRFTNTLRYLHATWTMMQQTITDIEPQHLSRTVMDTARRKGLPARVTVISLRRKVTDGTKTTRAVHWDHRWVVRGHWRWQHTGSAYPGAQETEKGYRARIWIAPFIKGPAEAELMPTRHVYDLNR
jgi:hypothetical protein